MQTSYMYLMYMYLMAIIDLHSRYVLKRSVSNTMAAEWCSRVLKEMLAIYPAPTIFNTDQGSQFTADIFTALLVKANVQISMDGKGRALDNIFVERLWRTVKYEDIYLKAYTDGWQLEAGLQAYRSGGPVRVLQLSALSSKSGLSNARTGIKGNRKQNKPSGRK